MAKKQTMTFTALPNGVVGTGADKKVRRSVYIAPRLSNAAGSTDKMDLSAFGDWVNWPDTATNISYKVSFNGGAGVTATPVGDPPIASLWGMLFGGTTKLVPHAFDQALTQTKIPLTYPVKDIHDKIQEIYTHFATHNPETFPTVGEILGGPLKDLTDGFLPTKKPVPNGPALAQGGMLAAPLVNVTQDNFKKVEAFHAPFNPDNRITPAPPDIDFHQMLSALGRYPFLMRLLGIVRDLETAHPGALGNATVQVIAEWPTKASSIVPVVTTNCVVSDAAFYARPRASSPDLSSDGLGMLKFADATEYEVLQVNQDGAALKTLNFAATVVHATFSIDDPVNYPANNLTPGYHYQGDAANRHRTDDTP